MSQWDGQSKGTILGYKIFVFIIKNIGIKAAYSLLFFVAFYYFVAYPSNFKAMYQYFRKRQQQPASKALTSVYRTYFTFGQTIIDKFAIFAGLRERFTFDFDGIEILKTMLAEKKGGVLISAHVGNFEIAEKFFADIDFDHQIHIVTVDQERSSLKSYFEEISVERTSVQYIYVKEDMSHIFAINEALSNNELICFTGDRYVELQKTMEIEFLGSEASFPAGTFALASRLKAPVAFVYVMKEPNLHYHLYTRRAPEIKHRDAHGVLQAYINSLTAIVKKYPYQWFNFFDFWTKK